MKGNNIWVSDGCLWATRKEAIRRKDIRCKYLATDYHGRISKMILRSDGTGTYRVLHCWSVIEGELVKTRRKAADNEIRVGPTLLFVQG